MLWSNDGNKEGTEIRILPIDVQISALRWKHIKLQKRITISIRKLIGSFSYAYVCEAINFLMLMVMRLCNFMCFHLYSIKPSSISWFLVFIGCGPKCAYSADGANSAKDRSEIISALKHDLFRNAI